MSQHDYDIANGTGATVRADLNSVLDAIATLNSGATAPTTTFANLWWFDTATDILKQRDEANTGWVNVAVKDGNGWTPYYQGSLIDAVFLKQANAVGQHTIYIPADALKPTTTNGAASQSRELATNDVMVSGLAFDAATRENAQFAFQMPKGWDEGTLIVQFEWTDAATAGTGDVVWGVEGLAVGDDDAMDAAFGTAATVTDTFLASGDLHKTPETAALTLAGTPAAEDRVILQVYRDAAAGGDTYGQDALLLGVRVHYTTDAVTDD